jgi:hypothetical protein
MNPLLALLASVLLVAALGKVRGAFGRYEAMSTALGELVPSERTAVGIWRALAIVEASVGVLLLAFPASRIPAALAATTLLCASVYTLMVLKKAPERPCGCFGVTAQAPSSPSTFTRALLLAATAAALALAGPGWAEVAPAEWWLVAAVAEAAALVAISPDLRATVAALARRGVPACLVSYVPPETSRVLLARSPVWERLADVIEPAALVDDWRDGCWSFLSYRTGWKGEQATAVFAIRVPPGPQHVRAMVVEDRTGRVVLEDRHVDHRGRPWFRARRRSAEHAPA